MEEVINIEINKNTLKKMLEAVLQSPHKKLIADVIVEGLKPADNSSTKNLSNLFHSLSGVRTELEDLGFYMDDVVSIKYSGVYNYSDDEAKMIEAGMLINGTIEGRIVGFNNSRENPIEVHYVYMNSSGKKKTKTDWVKPTYLTRNDHESKPKPSRVATLDEFQL